MNRKGMTLIEILCIAAVLLILSVAMLPVLKRSSQEAKADAAKQNLKGFWKALMLYQSENGSQTAYGKASEMGLPEAGQSWIRFCNAYTGDPHDGWETKGNFLPCGNSYDHKLNFPGINYMVAMRSDWLRDVLKYQDDTVVLYDKNCNDNSVYISSQESYKRSIGITLSGKIKDKTQRQILPIDQRFYR